MLLSLLERPLLVRNKLAVWRAENMQVCTISTNTADDFAHRGPRLHTMPFYIYRMYVRRVLKPSRVTSFRTEILRLREPLRHG